MPRLAPVTTTTFPASLPPMGRPPGTSHNTPGPHQPLEERQPIAGDPARVGRERPPEADGPREPVHLGAKALDDAPAPVADPAQGVGDAGPVHAAGAGRTPVVFDGVQVEQVFPR